MIILHKLCIGHLDGGMKKWFPHLFCTGYKCPGTLIEGFGIPVMVPYPKRQVLVFYIPDIIDLPLVLTVISADHQLSLQK